MKRSGFTMIELVFIIVILGILGAIAVPKMAASRMDARAMAIRTDIATAAQAIPAWVMSQGLSSIEDIDFRTGQAPISINKENWVATSKHSIYATVRDDGSKANPTHNTNNDGSCARIQIYPGDGNNGSEFGKYYLKLEINGGTQLCKRIGNLGRIEKHDNQVTVQHIPLIGTDVNFD